MKGSSDEVLMQQVLQGDGVALEIIYQRYGQPLFRYFLRMLWGDANKAEDFLHDLFIKIMDQANSYDSSKKFSTWLYSIAHNMCKNEYRRMTIRNGYAKTFQQEHDTIATKIDEDNFVKTLDLLLQKEDEEMKTMFSLRFELELEIREISEILQCPEGTIKSRLFYLKKKLASQLAYYKSVIQN